MPQAIQQPIGVFDSGAGGLSVLRQIRTLLPAESLLYVADTAWVPYGPRAPEEVRARSRQITQWLVERGAKAVVIACNTATAAAAAALREEFSIPIIGMEPAVKPAAAATRNNVVGVLATAGTLGSTRFSALLARFAEGIEVISRPSPELVELVEKGDILSAHARGVVCDCVEPLLVRGADTLILGCTHFHPLKRLIAEIAGPDVAIIDTGAAVARQVQRLLAEQSCCCGEGGGRTRVFVTGDTHRMYTTLTAVWGEAIEPEQLRLPTP